jgi:O-antigen/teichoic acid export membrane protein
MTAVAIVIAIGIGALLAGVFGPDSAIPAAEARLVLTALFAQVAVTNLSYVLDAWYRTAGRYALGVTLRQVTRLLEFGALLVAVLLGAQPGVAAVAFFAGSVAGFVLSWITLRRAVTWSTFRLERPDRATVRELLSPGLAFLAFPLCNALSIQGLTIVVGAILGSTAVVVFSTTRTMTRVALQVMASINLSIWPELSRSIGSGHLDEARAIQRRAVQLSLLFSGSTVVVLAVIGPALVRAWTHGVVDPPIALLDMLLLVVVANTFWFTLTTAIVATNRHERMAVVYLGSTITAVVLAIPLSAAFGLVGAAAALLAVDVGMSVYVFPAALRVVGDHPRPFIRAVLDVETTVRSVASAGRVVVSRRLSSVGRRLD